MITLYGHVPAWGIPDLSPFVTTIDLYLRMTGLSYRLVVGDLGTAPKGKLPYIEDGPTVVADTSFILEHLKAQHGDPLDGGLSARDEAVRLMIWRMMDESFYWYLVQGRYRRDVDFAQYDPLWAQFFGHLSEAERRAAIADARHRLLTEFYQSGRGRLSWEEVEHMGCREIDAVVAWLGETPYLFGVRPSSADCAAHAFLQGLIYVPFENGIKAHALAQPALVAYMARISERYYPELRAAQKDYADA
ncbi:MAG: glutathione S-transferase N-terminal domain-containing protein [Gammaproteobacteria bacterium]|nr:glutathione S-transferase N-terminal domain-containing protein [Gammaproteobacteria bacterium]